MANNPQNQTTSQTFTLDKLQMYDECPQKFKLCYLDKVHVVESIQNTKTGNNIHSLINYYLKGMDVTKLVTALATNEKLLWHNFKTSDIQNYKYVSSEYAFNVKFDEYWLTGRIDALFENNENYIVLDWKTGKHFLPENVKFQTSFYLLCMYEILKSKNLIKDYEQVSLHYMDLAANNKLKISLDKDSYIQYKQQILTIINKITTGNSYYCNKTDNCKQCKYYRACPYI